MDQSTAREVASATRSFDAETFVDQALAQVRPALIQLAQSLQEGVTPALVFQLEFLLFGTLRELGRTFLEELLNHLEGDGASLPKQVTFDGQGYRRLNKKTRNQHLATLFGTICLWRFPYRFCQREIPEPCLFPLELQLGLVESVTPALADWIGRAMAEAGATQARVLQQLQQEHGVSMGVKRLRKFIAALEAGLVVHQQTAQVEALLAALQTADFSRGNRKPVIAVGRDGITLREYKHRFWEVATAATVTIFDRAGKRLTTVYLAWRPELGQATMSQSLTRLLNDVLEQWHGPLPTLAYVADSGGNESSYYEDVLRRMRHPRTGQRLSWQRVVDFYHAAERVWDISEALFGKKSKQYKKWASRMLRVLKTKSNGPKRVLQSAAAHLQRRPLGKQRLKTFTRACNYLRKRTCWMQYRAYQQRHIPLGSGITEAACKSVFTQRLKLSGMRWSREGAQAILTLRTILLSRTWQSTFDLHLTTLQNQRPRPYAPKAEKSHQKAA